ncbi:MAG: nitroreductase family protein, partial [Candidatus Thorarchaeota archaeon]
MSGKDGLNLIRGRRSVRKFSDAPINEEIVNEIIETAISAPSAGNRQPWRVVVVRSEEMKNKLAEAALQTFIATADVVLAVCMVPEESAERYGDRGRTLYSIQDTAAMTQNILLAAHILGYGAVWIGAFNEKAVSSVLNIPNEMRPVSLIPIGGLEGPLPAQRKRRPI